MKTIIVDIRMLKALAIAASTDGARLSLHGVFLDKEGYAVATDGAILLCGALDAVLDKSFTIPSCLLDRIKPHKSFDSAQLTLDDDMTITIDYRGQKLIDKAIDSRFPDYRRVVPESVNSIHAHYNPFLLSRLQKAIAIYKNIARVNPIMSRRCVPEVAMNGDGPALVGGFGGNVFGVIMPIQVRTCAEPIIAQCVASASAYRKYTPASQVHSWKNTGAYFRHVRK